MLNGIISPNCVVLYTYIVLFFNKSIPLLLLWIWHQVCVCMRQAEQQERLKNEVISCMTLEKAC